MLPGTEGASFPFWSPDGRFIAFFASGKLRKCNASGGVSQVVADARSGRGGTWSRHGVILFSEGIEESLKQVPEAGGAPINATVLDASRGESSHRFPEFLADGRHFVYVNRAAPKYFGLWAGALDSKETKMVLAGNWSTAYHAGPYLLTVRQGNLIAHLFDVHRMQLAGAGFTIADQVASASPSGFASFSASPTGVLIYASGSSPNRELVWFTRSGQRLQSLGRPGEYASPALAPDGRTVAVARIDPQTRTPDIWLIDLIRGTESRFTFDPATDRAPLWSPDESAIVFASDRAAVWNLYRKAVNGSKPEEPLAYPGEDQFPSQWSPSTASIVYHTARPATGWDIGLVPLVEPSRPKSFLRTPFNEVQGAISPNGEWMAYASDETGSFEIYLQSVPAGGNKRQISVHGGSDPRWRPDGTELFYISLNLKLMSVKIRFRPQLEESVPKQLFGSARS